eukprot:2250150-Rhodomonas_salina.2
MAEQRTAAVEAGSARTLRGRWWGRARHCACPYSAVLRSATVTRWPQPRWPHESGLLGVHVPVTMTRDSGFKFTANSVSPEARRATGRPSVSAKRVPRQGPGHSATGTAQCHVRHHVCRVARDTTSVTCPAVGLLVGPAPGP